MRDVADIFSSLVSITETFGMPNVAHTRHLLRIRVAALLDLYEVVSAMKHDGSMTPLILANCA